MPAPLFKFVLAWIFRESDLGRVPEFSGLANIPHVSLVLW